MAFIIISHQLVAGFALLELISRGRNFPEVTRWRAQGLPASCCCTSLSDLCAIVLGLARASTACSPATSCPCGADRRRLPALDSASMPGTARCTTRRSCGAGSTRCTTAPSGSTSVGALYFHPFDSLGFTFVGSLMLVLGWAAAPRRRSSSTSRDVYGPCSSTPTSRPRTGSAHRPAPGKPLRASRARRPRAHYATFRCWTAVRHVPQPKEFTRPVGFYEGASRKVGPMLVKADLMSRIRIALGLVLFVFATSARRRLASPAAVIGPDHLGHSQEQVRLTNGTRLAYVELGRP